jgi:hypothetical protein
MYPTKYILMDGVNAIQLGRKNLGWKVSQNLQISGQPLKLNPPALTFFFFLLLISMLLKMHAR